MNMHTDWRDWHEQYRDPASPHSQRLHEVRAGIRAALDSTDGEVRVVSMCAGDGRDLLDVLADHPAAPRVRARLVELDPSLAADARTAAASLGLDGVEVVVGDAALTDAYRGAVPADLVLACGVFGNISDEDVRRTVEALPGFCAAGATAIWTRHRRAPDLTPRIREWFAQAGFAERAFTSPGPDAWSVGIHRLEAPPQPLPGGSRLFTFIR